MSEILEVYHKQQGLYRDFKTSVDFVFSSILREAKGRIHHISSRIKEKDSLQRKIIDKNYKYSSIEEITDIVGFRIITYFKDDVDIIKDIIEKEFNKDEENSIDKRNHEDNVFGYASLHLVVSFSDERLCIPEYSRYTNIRFEIQVRSLLEHGWAEIEHDLGYKAKSNVGIPAVAKRSFSRLAALLELADIEFMRLRTDLETYSSTVEDSIKREDYSGLIIDAESLKKFLINNSTVRDLESKICEYNKIGLYDDEDSYIIEEKHLKILNEYDVNYIKQINDIIDKDKDKLHDIANRIFEFNNSDVSGYYIRGFIMFYVSLYILAINSTSVDEFNKSTVEFLGIALDVWSHAVEPYMNTSK